MEKKWLSDRAFKIIVPVLLLCLVGMIWLIKDKASPSNSITEPGAVTNADFEMHVTQKLDLDRLKSYGLPIIIDFGADYCAPCREFYPVLKDLNATLQGKAIIKYIDVAKYRALAVGYPIEVIPTQIFIDKDGAPYKPNEAQARQMLMVQDKTSGEHIFTLHKGGMRKNEVLEVLREMGMVDE